MHQPGGSFNRPSRLRQKRATDRCAKLALPEAVEQSLCFPEVGGIDRAGNIWTINNYKPNFTVDAMRAKIQGVVVLEVIVRADGTVDPAAIRITRSLEGGLDREAVNAVRQWRFRPSLRLGQPVASRVIVELAFTLR